jgi:hypothetical protein
MKKVLFPVRTSQKNCHCSNVNDKKLIKNNKQKNINKQPITDAYFT